MTNYYFDEKGFFAGSQPANPGSLPPENAVRIAPPAREGFAAVLNAARDGWDLVAVAGAADAPSGDGVRRYLTATGKYHAEGCRHTRASGEWLLLADILRLRPSASPCGVCRPTGGRAAT